MPQERRLSSNMAFGVGAAKTGTHSLAKIFSGTLTTAHELGAEAFLRLILARSRGEISDEAYRQGIKAILVEQDIELSVAPTYGYIIRELYAEFPEAKFILTVRDAASWLRSLINQMTAHSPPPGSGWYAFRELRFTRDFRPHRPQDAVLRQYGLQSVDAYLGYWAKHNMGVIETVPARQLCIVATKHLARDSGRLFDFLAVKPGGVSEDDTHQYKGQYGERPLDTVDAGYLRERIDAYSTMFLEHASKRLAGDHVRYLEEAVSV